MRISNARVVVVVHTSRSEGRSAAVVDEILRADRGCALWIRVRVTVRVRGCALWIQNIP